MDTQSRNHRNFLAAQNKKQQHKRGPSLPSGCHLCPNLAWFSSIAELRFSWAHCSLPDHLHLAGIRNNNLHASVPKQPFLGLF